MHSSRRVARKGWVEAISPRNSKKLHQNFRVKLTFARAKDIQYFNANQLNCFKEPILPMAYGGHCYWVCAVCDVAMRSQIHVSNPTFWRRLLTQCIPLYMQSACPLLCNLTCGCIDFKLSAPQLRMQVQNTLKATTKQS